MPAKERIRIANCGGFWGDDPNVAERQVRGGPIDYLVMDYLAEITMAILQKQRQRDPEAGWARDFLVQLQSVLPTCVENGTCIISNAGGVNPHACRRAVEELAASLGLAEKVRVGVVHGDDLFSRLSDLPESEPLTNLDTGRPLSDVRDDVLSANVYLGAAGVVKALEMGANVIIAGRITDTAVALGPMIHEFGWASDDWDWLAAGVIAGHVIECGAQATGGNFTDWRLVPSFHDVGYPIVEAEPDGTFAITKHPGSGGLVTTHTVTEQLVYELGSPDYISPDCIAHFGSIRMEQDGEDRVRFHGIQGSPAPEKLKVSISHHQGWRAFGRLLVAGPEAIEKAKVLADAFWHHAGTDYEARETQYVGWNSSFPRATETPSEVLVQVAVRDPDRKKIERSFAPQLVPRVLASVPGVTYLADQGRPRASEVVGYWPALIGRDQVRVVAEVGSEQVEVPDPSSIGGAPSEPRSEVTIAPWTPAGTTERVPLARLCLARSGDKGDTCNVGVIARSDAAYGWIVDHLTSTFVKERFAELIDGEVERSELPNLRAVNFLLGESLGGGGTLSLRIDAQGKTLAQHLLAAEMDVDVAVLRDLDG